MTVSPSRYDALIIGARCAGAATAMLLARGGMKVLLVDWDAPGTDTMSTHALMRGATMQLARWGILRPLLDAGTPEVVKTAFHYGEEAVSVDIRPAHGTRGLVAPRRYLLDALLVDAARAAGATVRFGTAFRDVRHDGMGRVTGAVLKGPDGALSEVRAPLVIGADGRRSTVARRVGSPVTREAAHTIAAIYAHVHGLRNGGYRWYYAPGLGAGAIPTNDGAHCVFVGATPDRIRAEIAREGTAPALARLAALTNPALGEELARATAVSAPVVFSGAHGFLRRAAGPGWALVGDAGYFKDPLTAHGMTDAFRDAELLARAALAGGDAALADYVATRDALSDALFTVTDRIASLSWTLEELKADHLRLNRIMKDEQAWIAACFADARRAA